MDGIKNGFILEVTVPEDQYDEDGWTVAIRFNIAPNLFQGNFQLFNADVHNTIRHENQAVDLIVHMTTKEITDSTRSNVFTLVAERIPANMNRKY